MLRGGRSLLGVAVIAVLLSGCTAGPGADVPSIVKVPATADAPADTASNLARTSVAAPPAGSSRLVNSVPPTVKTSIPAPARTTAAPARTTATPARTTATPARTTATPARTTAVRTVTSTLTAPPTKVTVGPPRATAEPEAVDGDCPYLSAAVVRNITGQRTGQTRLVHLTPQPMCIFYRSDGSELGRIRIIKAATPRAAVAAVDQHVPIAGSQPATQPPGWSGGSNTTPGQMTQNSTGKSVYAVARAGVAVVAQENESPSLKARTMAVCAIYGLGLQAGTAPEVCKEQS